MPTPAPRRGRRAPRHNLPRSKARGQRWTLVKDRTVFDFGTFYGLDAYVRAHGDKWAVLRYDSEPIPVYIRDTPAAAMAAWDSHVKERGSDHHAAQGPQGPDQEEPPSAAA